MASVWKAALEKFYPALFRPPHTSFLRVHSLKPFNHSTDRSHLLVARSNFSTQVQNSSTHEPGLPRIYQKQSRIVQYSPKNSYGSPHLPHSGIQKKSLEEVDRKTILDEYEKIVKSIQENPDHVTLMSIYERGLDLTAIQDIDKLINLTNMLFALYPNAASPFSDAMLKHLLQSHSVPQLTKYHLYLICEAPQKLSANSIDYILAGQIQKKDNLNELLSLLKDNYSRHISDDLPAEEFFERITIGLKNNLPLVLDIHQFMVSHNIIVSDKVYVNIILLLVEKGSSFVEMTLDIYNQWKKTNGKCPLTQNLQKELLSYLSNNQKNDEFLSVVDDIQASSLVINPECFPIILRTYGHKEPSVMFSFYDKLIREGAQPTLKMYHGMLRALKSGKRVEEVQKIRTLMKKNGITPNSDTYELLFFGLDSPKDVMECWDEAQAADVDLYSQHSVQVLRKLSKSPDFVQLIEDFLEKLPVPLRTLEFNNALLVTMGRMNQINRAIELLKEMKSNDLPRDSRSYSVVKESLERKGFHDAVVELERDANFDPRSK
eukprot:TRINITY_DN12219_c0_g1_i1.p1 TRINITY_DN12219_c0_g1~~TRINITY_DN12219_c0_g1_i1.p1  ORF type:complete len:546 (+),score=91.15 TRINITY_DN12219_c0_g1_i1:7-1644(+)